LEELASQLSALAHVKAVILGGSISTGMNDERSDYDLYVYTWQPGSACSSCSHSQA